ncbi:hypothetical protein D3C76_1880200 [compost metagenome]
MNVVCNLKPMHHGGSAEPYLMVCVKVIGFRVLLGRRPSGLRTPTNSWNKAISDPLVMRK